MKAHVEDVLAGGGININPLYGTLGYHREEYDLSAETGARDYNPRRVCEIERKLYDYLEAEKVPVRVVGAFHCESFMYSNKGFLMVTVPADAEYREDQLERLVCVAHEIGHYLDYKFNYDFKYYDFKVNGKEEDKQKIIHKEVMAWTYACDILEALGFDNWDGLVKRMSSALGTYYKHLEVDGLSEAVAGIERRVRKEPYLTVLL